MKKVDRVTMGQRNESGMASILITMITMLVITLIVLGFATVARREQGQSLDRQLSTQAFYAAESGIEDAREVIEQALLAGKPVPEKTECDSNGPMAGYNPVYPTSTTGSKLGQGVEYSCLLVSPTPSTLQYNGINTRAQVVPIRTEAAMSRIVVKWTPNPKPPAGTTTSTTSGTKNYSCLDAATNVGTTRVFRPASNWTCEYPVMRADLVATSPTVNVPGAGNLAMSRDRLMNSMVTSYFVPTKDNGTGTGNVDYNTKSGTNYAASKTTTGAPTPIITKGRCAPDYSACTAEFRNLSPSTLEYTLRLSMIYRSADVTVTVLDAAGQPMEVFGAQAVIDVTGKAQDVLRRIVARVPVGLSRGETPLGPIESNGSLCKRFEVTRDFLRIPSGGPNTAFPTGNPDFSNETCKYVEDGTPQPN